MREKNEMKWLFRNIIIIKKNKEEKEKTNKISDNWKLGLPQLWFIPTGKTPWRLCLMHLPGLGNPYGRQPTAADIGANHHGNPDGEIPEPGLGQGSSSTYTK